MSRLPEVYCAIYAFLVEQGHVKAALAVKKAALPVVDIETGPAAAPGVLVELFARQVPVADANSNESSDHSSSSDDSSSSSSEDEAVASSAKVPVMNGKKVGTTNGSPKAPAKVPESLGDSSDSSDSSDSDDSSSSDEESSDSSDSSSSSSDSSSDEEDKKAESPAKPTTDSKQKALANGVAEPTVNGKSKAKDSDSSSSSEDSSGSSSSESESESEPETRPPAKKRKVDADSVVPVPATTTTKTKTTTVATTSESVTLTESTTTSTTTSANDKKVKHKGPRKPLVPFSRIKADEVVYADPRLMNNSFDSKGGTINDYGERASRDLIVTRGAGFRKEKNKKKKGSYRGGEITMQSHSIKFT
ncbi:Nucleolar and coiled-body phosphoprotein 1 [Rhizoctonia solani]|uniref:Nucleolar and coiled-body phosphoprotein 1 n=1 Tax=Rhizoctonia solani TaxID=456999 RepID=A0A0K6FSK7_9AGAM|nr:Nucleolar and coiled-body phosphoprotein 1 [Rhizoctonia solani]